MWANLHAVTNHTQLLQVPMLLSLSDILFLQMYTGVMWTVRREDNHCEMQSSLAVTETTENHPYATLERKEPPTYELPSDILEKKCIDYTVIYEDPTSPSYVVYMNFL